MSTLVNQIPVYPGLPVEGRQDVLSACIANFAVAALSRDEHIKKLNLDVLMQTRSEDPRVRLYALRTCVQAWTVAGPRFAGKQPSFNSL
jgi:U3 small nucleolar RNA-associated protein 10